MMDMSRHDAEADRHTARCGCGEPQSVTPGMMYCQSCGDAVYTGGCQTHVHAYHDEMRRRAMRSVRREEG